MFEFHQFAQEVCAGDSSIALEFIQEFSEQYCFVSQCIHEAYASNTTDQTINSYQEIHKIVGASGLMGFKHLSRELKRFEDELKASPSVQLDFIHRFDMQREAFLNAADAWKKSNNLTNIHNDT